MTWTGKDIVEMKDLDHRRRSRFPSCVVSIRLATTPKLTGGQARQQHTGLVAGVARGSFCSEVGWPVGGVHVSVFGGG